MKNSIALTAILSVLYCFNIYSQIIDSSSVVKHLYQVAQLDYNIFKLDTIKFTNTLGEYALNENGLLLTKTDSISSFKFSYSQYITTDNNDPSTGTWSRTVSLSNKVLDGLWSCDKFLQDITLYLEDDRAIKYWVKEKNDTITFIKNDTSQIVKNHLYTATLINQNVLMNSDSLFFSKSINPNWKTYTILYTEKKNSYSYFNIEHTSDDYIIIQDPQSEKWVKKKVPNELITDGLFNSSSSEKITFKLSNGSVFEYVILLIDDKVAFIKI